MHESVSVLGPAAVYDMLSAGLEVAAQSNYTPGLALGLEVKNHYQNWAKHACDFAVD